MATVQLESTYTSCAVTSLSVIAPGIVCGGMGRLLRVWKPKPSHHQQQQRGQGGADIGGGSGVAIASLETTLPVLPSTAVIHLIRPCREHEAEERQGGGGGGQVKVAVCGHKQVAVVTVTAAPSSLDVAVAWKLPELDDLVVEADWIRTALSSSSSTSVPDLALVYAHNLVELWPYMAAAPTRRVLATDRSLLYSAKLMPQLEASNFYIAAGTVFSEVLIWSGSDRKASATPGVGAGAGAGAAGEGMEAPVQCKLNGHQGVIMAIDVTADGNTVGTASDDRSVRIWDISGAALYGRGAAASNNTATAPAAAASSTTVISGFVGGGQAVSAAMIITPIQTLYGHISRVWRLCFATAASGEQHLMSCGEDATLCCWKLDGTLVRKFDGHEGKSIWSCATDDTTSTVFTGGGDGGVRSWSLQPEDLDPSCARVTAGMAMATANTVQKGNGGGGDGSGGEQKDFPRTIAVVNRRVGFVCTHGGAVHAVDFDKPVNGDGNGDADAVDEKGRHALHAQPQKRASAVRTEPIAIRAELAGHSILAAVAEVPVGCAGGSKGDLVLFGCDQYAQEPYIWKGHDASVCAIFWPTTLAAVGGEGKGGAEGAAAAGAAGQQASPFPLFTCTKGILKWWHVGLLKPFTEPVLAGTFVLPGAGWAQSLAYDELESRLYVGDRAGGLYIFDCSAEVVAASTPEVVESSMSHRSTPKASQQPVHSISKAHGKKTVTHILLNEDGSVYTAGRDGYYRHFAVEHEAVSGGSGGGGSAGGQALVSTCLGKHRVNAKLDWIVRLEKHNGCLVALGFEKDHFVCIDTTTGVELCRISCGGGHRSWGFASGSNMAYNHVFVFIRNSLVNSSSISPSAGPGRAYPAVVHPGLGGREVSTVKLLRWWPDAAPMPITVMITSGEDCFIRLSVLSAENGAIQGKPVSIKADSSSIRTLAISGSVLFAAGGKGVVKCWRLSIEGGATPSALAAPLVEWPPSYWKPVPDYRIMSVDAFELGGGWHGAVIARSDGNVQFLRVNEDTCRVEELGLSDKPARCQLSAAHIYVAGARRGGDAGVGGGARFAAAGGTDGFVSIWRVTDVFSKSEETFAAEGTAAVAPVVRHRLHQSGVNALELTLLGGNAAAGTVEVLVVTGGDDNALAAAVVQLPLAAVGGSCVVLRDYRLDSAHGASITGIQLDASSSRALTVAADGRLSVWKYNCNGSVTGGQGATAVAERTDPAILPELVAPELPEDVWCQLLHGVVASPSDVQDVAILAPPPSPEGVANTPTASSVGTVGATVVAVVGVGVQLFQMQ